MFVVYLVVPQGLTGRSIYPFFFTFTRQEAYKTMDTQNWSSQSADKFKHPSMQSTLSKGGRTKTKER